MDEVPEARPRIRRARKLDRGQFVRVALAGRFGDLDDGVARPVPRRADVAQPADAVVDQAGWVHQYRLHRGAGSGAGGAGGGAGGGGYL